MRVGYRNHRTHFVAVGVEVPEGTVHVAICGQLVKVGPRDVMGVLEAVDCKPCAARYLWGFRPMVE
jgi:hypothetical protein